MFYLLVLVVGFVNAQYTLIPDSDFEQYLLDHNIDSEGILDGQVLTSDIDGITSLYMCNFFNGNIQDLTGIEGFESLIFLCFTFNNLTSLDLTNNLNLKQVSLDYTNLTSLDVSNLTNLEELRLTGNNLGDNLNITNCTSLKTLYCNAGLTSIDLSTNVALEYFLAGFYAGFDSDQLVSLDFSNCPNLNAVRYRTLGNYTEEINLKNGNNVILDNVLISCLYLECLQVDEL